ncbi:MAG: acyltransferase family protein [Sulfurovum sp.]|nr:acyltransferase family protein [Sulfurovum sp.]
MPDTRPQRFNVLDSFRGLSALIIVVFHMQFSNSITEYIFFQNAKYFVDFFFVLSGFVLTHSYFKNVNISFKRFFISRTFRIFPLHLLMLFVFVLLELGKFFAYKYGVHFNHIPFSGETAINQILPNALLLQSWLPHTISTSWNNPAWSISVEYYLYFIFFATFMLKNNFRKIIWFFISIASFFIILQYSVSTEILRGLSGFFAGAITYIIYSHTHHIRNKYIYSFLEVTVLMAVYLVLVSTIKEKSVILSLLFCGSIFIFSYEKGIVSTLLRKKLFLFFGKISYSIYLVHASIIVCLKAVVLIGQKLLNTQWTYMENDIRYIDFGSGFLNNFIVLLLLGIVVFVSNLTYRYIEVKGQKFGKKLNDNFGKKVLA